MKNKSTLEISDSSSSNKIKTKAIRKKVKKKNYVNNKNGQLNDTVSLDSQQEICAEHNHPIDFLCIHINCNKVLCGRCILDHKIHIDEIKYISDIIEQFEQQKDQKLSQLIGLLNSQKQKENNNSNNKTENNQNYYSQLNNLNQQNFSNILQQLDKTESSLIQQIQDKIEKLRIQSEQQLISNKKILFQIEGLQNIEGKIETAKNYSIINHILSNNNSTFNQWLFQNEEYVKQQVGEVIDQNLTLVNTQHSLESSNQNTPKLLHWFEWGKNRLIIYDIVQNRTEEIQLETEFKVPAFSRSVMLKDSRIYLMGGEQPEYYSRKEVYCYQISTKSFIKKQNMLIKKFDFSICAIMDSIYVLCGKDQQSTVSDSCERYNCTSDRWESICKTNINRYAATAVGYQNKFIYLFGGRGDQNHEMISLIERYSIQDNLWNTVNIKMNEQLWQPVEVCAGIEIADNQILVFGGSEAQLQDTYELKFSRREDLLKSHIFVQQPFLYGQYVYGVGNEYYIKQRNLHRYHIATDTWDLLF